MGERGQRLGDADHVLERVDALVDVADVRLAAGRPDAQRDRAAGACQITPPVGSAVSIATASGSIRPASRRCPEPAVLPVSSSQTKWKTIRRPSSRPSPRAAAGAVEHRDQAALHVRGPAPDHLPVAAHGLELRRALGRDDVEVPVVVDELRPVAHAAAHDRGLLRLPVGGARSAPARSPAAPGRRRAAAQRPSSRPGGFSVGTRTSASSSAAISSARPSSQGLHIGAAIAQAVSVPNWMAVDLVIDIENTPGALARSRPRSATRG